MLSDSKELKKHVNVVHSYGHFTLVQRKLVNALLYNAYYELEKKSTFSMSTKELCELIGYHSRDLIGLKRSLRGLLSTVIEWNIIDANTRDNDKWTATTMLSHAEISKGLCKYSYSEVMRELLYKPDIYADIDMHVIKNFKSNYGLALYENCIRFKRLNQTCWFQFGTFRRLMGVDEKKYKVFKDFKKRVIDVAVTEVNKYAPIDVFPEINKAKEEIRFLISKTDSSSKNLIDLSEKSEAFTVMTGSFGVTKKIAKELLDKYGEEYIKEKVEIVMQSPSFKAGTIKHLAGYLIDALENDYQLPISSHVLVRKKEKEKEQAKKEEKNRNSEIERKYTKYVNGLYIKFEKSLDEKTVRAYQAECIETLKGNAIFMKRYKDSGFEHPMIKAEYRKILREKMPQELGFIMSKEEFEELLCT